MGGAELIGPTDASEQYHLTSHIAQSEQAVGRGSARAGFERALGGRAIVRESVRSDHLGICSELIHFDCGKFDTLDGWVGEIFDIFERGRRLANCWTPKGFAALEAHFFHRTHQQGAPSTSSIHKEEY